ncbi:MAG TPA: hypothetical protein VHC69_05045 [Polyangiaceae bacterium]|nr:hypothetical protein [Polyangiaceae bacterium]
MSTPRTFVWVPVLVASLGGCGKASAPPPEAATAPAATTAPPPSATSPVVETTPTTGNPEPGPTAASAPVVPPAEPGPNDTAPGSSTSGAPPAPPASRHGAPKEHAETAATPAAEGPTPDDPCQTKNFHYTQIESACKSGGRRAVKAIMKGVIRKAKAAGTDLQCTSCHEDMKDFHLKSNAVGDLKNWL